ncbi:hypothetical protein EDEG_00376 [Edhazardia aedis USNM 41457]|uniref:Uncharacterized protein n=1 Tax=Edhazardia aedis (strain USNM 41457) TaxID=1003232 RepID=J9DGP6_EDHAE|nr:hypothetical protein EDEG_00376 [Edhazardia aedis USNM 41457]|eukprot:EJW01785.1 hypothetical protein EDEG_00376 [Edhazardia aedis USNM 41457]
MYMFQKTCPNLEKYIFIFIVFVNLKSIYIEHFNYYDLLKIHMQLHLKLEYTTDSSTENCSKICQQDFFCSLLLTPHLISFRLSSSLWFNSLFLTVFIKIHSFISYIF